MNPDKISDQGSRKAAGMDKILFLTSSHKIGLTSQLTQQALCFNSLSKAHFLFVSGEKEQYPGLFDKLRLNKVNHEIIDGIDDHKNFSRLASAFRQCASRFKPSIVVVHTNWQLAIAVASKYRGGLQFRIIYIMHGFRHNYRFRSIIAKIIIGLALYAFADAVIMPSTWLMKQFGIIKRKTRLIFLGEDDAYFINDTLPDFSGTKRFIFAAEFRTGKNQDMLIRAIKKYTELTDDNDVKLYLPGKGYIIDKCKQLAKELGLESKIVFPGFIDRESMLDLYLSCQYSFVSSNVETFGHCIAEPFILGRVVISRPVGVADDIIIHERTGFLFRDEQDLINLLCKIMPDATLCAQVSRNAYMQRDLFRWNGVCNQHHAVFLELT
jgi:glycosyltransferase involved in cell wall biosynthesis